MGWTRVDEQAPPIGRPVLVRTLEGDEPVVAFLTEAKVWYEGGALVQGSMTVLGATPVAWCEPEGDSAL
jgi:hypothetical protein